MKSILFIFFLFTSLLSVFSQNKNGEFVKGNGESLSQSQTVVFKIDSAKLALKNNIATNHSKKTVAYYDNYVNSLEVKRAYIESDQSLKEKAEADGWFVFIDGQIAEAKRSKNLLLKSQNNEK